MSDETTVTERMKALLDQLGVKYGGDRGVVYFEDSRGYKAMAYDAPRRYGNGVLCVHHTATPEQAVEATLGRGTCKDVHEPPRNTTFWPTPHFKCSECGATHVSMDYVYYCPNCGRKVVDE